jgi:predicted dehydrogenase
MKPETSEKDPPGITMNRRKFIATAALASAAPSSFVRAAEQKRFRVGILGAAHSHALEKFKLLRESTDYELIGVCEEAGPARESLAKLGAKFISQDELLNRAEIVVVESAVRDHARLTQTALEADKHVHVEKPPATNMAEMQTLVALAREKNRLLQVGYMWRHHPGLNVILEAAKRGWLGEVYLVRATMNSFIDAARRPEWAEFKGGAMFELGCHLIDPVVRLLGAPLRVRPQLQRRGGDDLADNCVALFNFAKAQAIITTAVLQPNSSAHRFFEVLGTNGTARAQPIEPPSLTLDLAKAAGPYQTGVQKVELSPYRRYVGEFAELAKALREKTPLGTSFDEELRVHEAMLRASDMF